MSERIYPGNLYKIITLQDLQQGPVHVADDTKVDSEFNALTRTPGITFADPSAKGSFGNVASAVVIPVVTPVTPSTEFVLTHNLGYAPVGILQVVPVGTVGAQFVIASISRKPDTVNAYLKCPNSGDANVVTSFVLY